MFSQNDFEVIVVNNGTTDITKEIIRSYENKIKNIEYFYEFTPGLHVGRYRGYMKQKQKYLFMQTMILMLFQIGFKEYGKVFMTIVSYL